MNPITQMLNRTRSTGMMNNLSMIKGMMGNNPNAVFNQMLNNNPQFRQFVEQNRGKTPEQIASAYGIDIGQVQNLLR